MSKIETDCSYALLVEHGQVGTGDVHLPAIPNNALWKQSYLKIGWAAVTTRPWGIAVTEEVQHFVPTCHPGFDVGPGGKDSWYTVLFVPYNPLPRGVVSKKWGQIRAHQPHGDIFAHELTFKYASDGDEIKGYTYTSTGAHDKINVHAACAPATPDEAVPATASEAFGSASIVVNGLTFECSVAVGVIGIAQSDVIGSAICIGSPGQVGPPIFDLGPGSQWQDQQGIGIGRTILNAAFPSQYLQALTAGQTYVNIQTQTYPQGEIRGQLTIPPMSQSGDMNCDGTTDMFDTDAFVQALIDPAGYAASHPSCTVISADVNGDGVVDARDIEGFIALLLSN